MRIVDGLGNPTAAAAGLKLMTGHVEELAALWKECPHLPAAPRHQGPKVLALPSDQPEMMDFPSLIKSKQKHSMLGT